MVASNNKSPSSFGNPLPESFQPGPFDVICARGVHARNHSGNQRYRLMIDMRIERYSKTTSKTAKSFIVAEIIDNVLSKGSFVRFKGGRWYEAKESLYREKIGQGFRDRLHTKYTSSSKAKYTKKRNLRTKDDATDSSESTEETETAKVFYEPSLPQSSGVHSENDLQYVEQSFLTQESAQNLLKIQQNLFATELSFCEKDSAPMSAPNFPSVIAWPTLMSAV